MSKKIIDCFIFYNEIELLNYRLNVLNKVVDKFVIVEATHTFSGEKKQMYFKENENTFETFKEKIIHIVVDDLPYKSTTNNSGNAWFNEHCQRNSISLGINQINLDDEDIIIITDADEIPDPNTLLKIKNNEISVDINALELDLYYYNLNSKFIRKWNLSKIISYKKYKEISISCNDIRSLDVPSIKNGGWHLSYFGDAIFIKNKIEAFSHQELNNEYFKDISRIEKNIKSSTDLYDRSDQILTSVLLKDNNYLPIEYEKYLQKYYL